MFFVFSPPHPAILADVFRDAQQHRYPRLEVHEHDRVAHASVCVLVLLFVRKGNRQNKRRLQSQGRIFHHPFLKNSNARNVTICSCFHANKFSLCCVLNQYQACLYFVPSTCVWMALTLIRSSCLLYLFPMFLRLWVFTFIVFNVSTLLLCCKNETAKTNDACKTR